VRIAPDREPRNVAHRPARDFDRVLPEPSILTTASERSESAADPSPSFHQEGFQAGASGCSGKGLPASAPAARSGPKRSGVRSTRRRTGNPGRRIPATAPVGGDHEIPIMSLLDFFLDPEVGQEVAREDRLGSWLDRLSAPPARSTASERAADLILDPKLILSTREAATFGGGVPLPSSQGRRTSRRAR